MIDGSKQFITNSGTPITRFVTVTAVTGNENGRKEISTIIVPNGTPGSRSKLLTTRSGGTPRHPTR